MSILQALDRYYDRLPDVAAPGWSTEPIGVVLELDADGSLLAADSWLDGRRKPRVGRVPKWFTRSGIGSTPYFLWDNAAYVLGLGAKDPGKTARDHAAFKAMHLAELADEKDEGFVALRRFLKVWTPNRTAVANLDDKLLTFNIAFRLRGETQLLHERAAVAPHVERLRLQGKSEAEGFCLIRGARLPLVRLHPKIKGVDGTASAEVPLVSFNVDAFTSYGKEQGFNAPTSEAAAFRYGAALNALLTRGGRNRLRIGDASVAFWADASALDAALAEQAAREAESMFASEFDDTPLPEAATDEQQAALVRSSVATVAKGRPEWTLDPGLKKDVKFYVLGLAPNAARLSVRYWLANSFGHVESALAKHRDDIDIEPHPWSGKPPSIQRLLVKTTALQEKFDNIPKGLAGEVMRAVLTGGPYPRTWLATALIRLRASGDPGRGWHAAVVKACINRIPSQEPVPVSLNPNHESPAYQLGRLFAVLEAAQYAALGRVNASIADRYYGAASSTPARVFAALIRGAKTHISDARKRNRGLWVESRMQDIIARLPPDLPSSLRLEDQGRFAVGYYHERASRPAKADVEEIANGSDDKENAQ
jgi:CRISPR-associated protein Csd1